MAAVDRALVACKCCRLLVRCVKTEGSPIFAQYRRGDDRVAAIEASIASDSAFGRGGGGGSTTSSSRQLSNDRSPPAASAGLDDAQERGAATASLSAGSGVDSSSILRTLRPAAMMMTAARDGHDGPFERLA